MKGACLVTNNAMKMSFLFQISRNSRQQNNEQGTKLGTKKWGPK
jgi:hypothetical protein